MKLKCSLHILGIARDKDNVDRGAQLLAFYRQGNPIELSHLNIQKHDIRLIFSQIGKGLLRIGKTDDFRCRFDPLKHGDKILQSQLFIINRYNFHSHDSSFAAG